MFKPGDIIIYGNTGVCRVEEISCPNLPGADKTKEYYLLTPLFQEGKIYTPVDNSKVFIRSAITRQQADELIDMIPQLQVHQISSTSIQQLDDRYRAFFSTHNCADLLELIISVYNKKHSPSNSRQKLGQIDERYMKRAEGLLYGELAYALGITPKEVPHYISCRINQLSKE